MTNNPTSPVTTQRKKIEEIRFTRFLLNDKDNYVCYRFTIALEKLIPPRLSQLKLVSAWDGETTADSLFIEVTPEGVYKRYVYPALEDHFMSYEEVEKVQELARLYCRYLSSNQEDRLRYYNQDKKKWQKFI